MIIEEIPKVSHSTHVSKYLVVTYISIVLSIVENVIAFLLSENASDSAAKLLDWVFLSVYGAVILVYSLVLVLAGIGKSEKVPHRYPLEEKEKRTRSRERLKFQ